LLDDPRRLCDVPHPAEVDERYHVLNMPNVTSAVYWHRFFEMVGDVPGDIVECGIGRGRSLLIIAALNELLNDSGSRRHIFAYDSFKGFPAPSEQDQSPRMPRQGEWSHSPSGRYQYSEQFIRDVLASASVDGSAVTMTAGFFDQTLPHHPRRPIALLHLDGDLYVSYKTALDNLYDLVSSGGVVVFDDFSFEPEAEEKFPGARRAVLEFFGKDAPLRRSVRGTAYLVKDRG
jgi:O-methyltransferase